MNASDKNQVKFLIICVSNNCPGTEEWTGFFRDLPMEYREGLIGVENYNSETDSYSYEEPEYTASIFKGTYRQLREALSDSSHSSHSLSDNCETLCLGDYY